MKALNGSRRRSRRSTACIHPVHREHMLGRAHPNPRKLHLGRLHGLICNNQTSAHPMPQGTVHPNAMEQDSTKTGADGMSLFAGEAWFDPAANASRFGEIEAGIRDRVRGFIEPGRANGCAISLGEPRLAQGQGGLGCLERARPRRFAQRKRLGRGGRGAAHPGETEGLRRDGTVVRAPSPWLLASLRDAAEPGRRAG